MLFSAVGSWRRENVNGSKLAHFDTSSPRSIAPASIWRTQPLWGRRKPGSLPGAGYHVPIRIDIGCDMLPDSGSPRSRAEHSCPHICRLLT